MTDVTRPAVPLLAGAGRLPGKRRQVHVTGGRKKKKEKELESMRKKEGKKVENERKEEKDDNLPVFFFG